MSELRICRPFKRYDSPRHRNHPNEKSHQNEGIQHAAPPGETTYDIPVYRMRLVVTIYRVSPTKTCERRPDAEAERVKTKLSVTVEALTRVGCTEKAALLHPELLTCGHHAKELWPGPARTEALLPKQKMGNLQARTRKAIKKRVHPWDG
eukprot:7957092-Pyramimonas_sp.AAC.1